MIVDRLIRMKELKEILGLGTSTIYRMISDNKFPKPIKLTERTVAWRMSTINEWIESREKVNN
jgi:prophage regulatory protein